MELNPQHALCWDQLRGYQPDADICGGECGATAHRVEKRDLGPRFQTPACTGTMAYPPNRNLPPSIITKPPAVLSGVNQAGRPGAEFSDQDVCLTGMCARQGV